MDIGSVLRESRINAKMSVGQVSEILTEHGYKASQKTVYSWEKGNSRPDIEILMKLCDIYGIKDILRTFGYNGYNDDGSIQLNLKEIEHKGKTMALHQERIYTLDDIYALPDGQRAELIDGRMYMMAPPARIHQKLVTELVSAFHQYIKINNGGCEVYPAPFAVFLNEDDRNYVEPDISVICDKNKLTDKGCDGAPDLVIEIISPSTQQMDYGIKLFKYRTAGVREYWIINPATRIVNVYDFENESGTRQYSFDDKVHVCIYEDLCICISEIL